MKDKNIAYIVCKMFFCIESIFFLIFLIFPIKGEKIINDYEEVIEEKGKTSSVTNKRDLTIVIPKNKKIDNLYLEFYKEGELGEGEIKYEIFENDQSIAEGNLSEQFREIQNSSSQEIIIKIPIEKKSESDIKIIVSGENIPLSTKIGVYTNNEDGKSTVRIFDEGINKRKTPIYSVGIEAKSYPYQWDLLLLITITAVCMVVLKEKRYHEMV